MKYSFWPSSEGPVCLVQVPNGRYILNRLEADSTLLEAREHLKSIIDEQKVVLVYLNKGVHRHPAEAVPELTAEAQLDSFRWKEFRYRIRLNEEIVNDPNLEAVPAGYEAVATRTNGIYLFDYKGRSERAHEWQITVIGPAFPNDDGTS